MPEANKIKVAVASDFLSAFASIPRKQQARVLDFVNKFREDPTSPGINYEKIRGARDPSLRSVRIDQAYRGIVLKPESGNVYLLLWVDHHDEAYRWAEKKLYHIHPETGSLQVIDTEKVEGVSASQPEAVHAERRGLFAEIRDRQLVSLGVPETLLPVVRGITTEDDLDRHSEQFPEEAYDALILLAAGSSVEEVSQELDKSKPAKPIDTTDYAAALENPESQRRFYIVEEDLELEAILHAPLEKWRVFLHPSQSKLVKRDWNGPVRVLGGAGTGKTVVAMHRAKWLAQNRFNANGDRILFTTFTRNLAADIRENLSKICTNEVMQRIEVVNLDKWVSDFLRKNGYSYQIDYGNRTQPLWEKALALIPGELGLDHSFYREEWEQIIQPQSVTSLAEYINASRVGRGVRLSRKQRKAIWPVFEDYRLQLDEQGLREPEDATREAGEILVQKGDILPYRAVIVDEAQDMGAQAVKLIRQMIPGGDRQNDLFIVGDAHQRIYRHKVVLSHCGINIRGRSRKLRINYRTTEENRRWAVSLLKEIRVDDLDGGQDDQKGYKSLLHGVMPEIRSFETFEDEVNYIANDINNIASEDDTLNEVCIVARTHEFLEQYRSVLDEKGFETHLIRRSEPENRKLPGVRLATMHRVKGLEFNRVIIAGVNDGIVPLEVVLRESSDPIVRRESEVRERALLYVAATRAKRGVLVTSYGKPSRFLTN